MSAETLCRRVTQFGFSLLGAGFALDARQHRVDRLSSTRKAVIWTRTDERNLIANSPSRISDYMSILENQEYSYLMHDGGIIQVAYVLNRKDIEKHRLAYYPCPFQINDRDFSRYGGAIIDYLTDNMLDDFEANVVLRSPIRFDFAPDAAADFHPASHVTINDSSCRIPARAPLTFDTFMKFVLENFYLSAWKTDSVAKFLRFGQEPECMSQHDRRRAYISWTHP